MGIKLGKTNLSVSRLSFGTAEIGFSYGIGPRSLPSEKEAVRLLQEAVDLGITFFDTASYYGLAEERIGKSGILKNEKVIVETKCAKFLEEGTQYSPSETKKIITEEVDKSLAHLKVDALPILLLHGPSKEQIEEGVLIETLKELKTQGKIRFTGVSTRGEEAPMVAIASNFFDVIQIAYSILDQRMEKNVLPFAGRENIGVVSRSALLKGTLTPSVIYLPEKLAPLKKNAEKIQAIAQKMGISSAALALRFTLSEKNIDTTLIGTNKIKNLKEAVGAVTAGPLPSLIYNELVNLAIPDPDQVDPARWPKA